MSTQWIVTEKKNHMTTVTLNRPEKRNALNGEMIDLLLASLKKIAHDKSCRVFMICGAGDVFCAGGDIAWMKEMAEKNEAENVADALLLADCLYQLYQMPMPTIALAQGTILGGGVGLLCACDMVIASNNAQFGFSEVKLGLSPSTISPYVIRAIGERATRYYFLTGERFSSEIAKRLGLVHLIVNQNELAQKGDAMAHLLLQNSPEALQACKSLIHAISLKEVTPNLNQTTAKHLSKRRASKEAKEGLRAFLEKRTPHWNDT